MQVSEGGSVPPAAKTAATVADPLQLSFKDFPPVSAAPKVAQEQKKSTATAWLGDVFGVEKKVRF